LVVNVCSIAGLDPSGGAGILADVKTFSALGAYGMAVVTALTAQSTVGVAAVTDVDPAFVSAQIDAVFSDIGVDAVKIGMLANAGVIAAVADALERWRPPVVVLDPVMIAKSGDHLLDPGAVTALAGRLLPLVHLVTPNLPEAATLLGEHEAASAGEMAAQGRRLQETGVPWVLVKGGHLEGPASDDVLCGPAGAVDVLHGRRVETANTHGTGCTLSSAIAALRPRHRDWPEAVRAAKGYLTGALSHAGELAVGHGHGPVHHFHAMWPVDGSPTRS
jgi:hydroxymethylpyrimidine/phosphomethylpyrimidine kinase